MSLVRSTRTVQVVRTENSTDSTFVILFGLESPASAKNCCYTLSELLSDNKITTRASKEHQPQARARDMSSGCHLCRYRCDDDVECRVAQPCLLRARQCGGREQPGECAGDSHDGGWRGGARAAQPPLAVGCDAWSRPGPDWIRHPRAPGRADRLIGFRNQVQEIKSVHH